MRARAVAMMVRRGRHPGSIVEFRQAAGRLHGGKNRLQRKRGKQKPEQKSDEATVHISDLMVRRRYCHGVCRQVWAFLQWEGQAFYKQRGFQRGPEDAALASGILFL